MRKKSLQIKLTIMVGVILLISNALLVILLNYSTLLSFNDIVVPIDGMIIEIHSFDNFSESIRVYGLVLAVVTTVSGTLITYFVLGKFLSPIKGLSKHMKLVDEVNKLESIELVANTKEVEILVSSFNHMTKRLKESFETQKNFSSYIAHQMRTPLAVMSSKIDVFLKNEQDEKVKNLLEDLNSQSKKLNTLITKIIELVGVNSIELNDRVPLDLIIDEVFEDVDSIAKSSDISLKLESKKSYSIIGSHNLIYQAFYNIIENAIKYSEKTGEVFVTIDEELDNMIVKVLDNGCGISDEDKKKIFEPFFQCDSSKNGIGMGLAFAKRVFEHHSALLNVYDNTQKGTVFEVVLSKNKEVLDEAIGN